MTAALPGKWTAIAVRSSAGGPWTPLPNRISLDEARSLVCAGHADMRTVPHGRGGGAALEVIATGGLRVEA